MSDPFRENLLRLCDHTLVVIAERNKIPGARAPHPMFVGAAKAILGMTPEDKLVSEFCERSWSRWEDVRLHRVDYFRDHASDLFGGVPEGMVTQFKDFLLARDAAGNLLTDLDPYWAYCEALVKAAAHHIHRQRDWGPSKADPTRMVYRKKYMAQVKLGEVAEAWGLTF